MDADARGNAAVRRMADLEIARDIEDLEVREAGRWVYEVLAEVVEDDGNMVADAAVRTRRGRWNRFSASEVEMEEGDALKGGLKVRARDTELCLCADAEKQIFRTPADR